MHIGYVSSAFRLTLYGSYSSAVGQQQQRDKANPVETHILCSKAVNEASPRIGRVRVCDLSLKARDHETGSPSDARRPEY